MSELNDLLTRFKQEDAGQVPDAQPIANTDLIGRYKQEDAVLNAFATAHKTNPDEYARLRKTAIDAGMTPEQVDMFPEEAARRSKYDQSVRLTQDAPLLAKWMTVEDNAKLGHDNVENMAGIERTFKGTLGDIGVTALKGAVGLPQAFVGLADIPTLGYTGKAIDAAGLRFNETQKILDTLYSPAQQQANREVRGAEGFFDTLREAIQNPSVIATTVGESLPQMLGGAAVARGILTIGAKTASVGPSLPGLLSRTVGAGSAPLVAGAAGEGVVGAGAAAEQIRGEGTLSVGQSGAALASGAGTGLLALLGGKLAQKLGVADVDTALASGQITQETVNKSLVRTLAEAGLSEGVFEELPQSAQEQVWQNVATDKPAMEGVANAAAMGLLAGSVTGGGFQGVQHIASRGFEKTKAAEQQAAFLENINKLAAADKLLQRSPDDFQAFVASAAEDGPVDTVFIDGKTLMQSGMAPRLAELSPSVVEQLDRAILTGGQIAIPVDEYAARIAPTDLAPQLIDHLKTEPDGFTRAEAADFMANAGADFQAEVERVMGNQADADTFRASQDVVKQDILGQLNTAGRFTPQVNEAYATLASAYSAVRAAQMGLTPEAFHQQRGMRVQGAAVAGQQFSQAFDLPDGYTIEEGTKGLAKGKFRVIGEDGESLGNWGDTHDAAINDALKNAGVRKANTEEQSRRDEAYSRVGLKVSSGADLTDVDLTSIGLKPGQSRFDYLSPRIQRLLGIPARKVREAIGDALRKGQGQFGGAIEIANSRDAIANAAKWAKDNLDPADPNILNQSAVAEETDQDRLNSVDAARVSPRLPTAVKATEDAMAETRLQPDLATAMRDTAAFAFNIDLMAQYPNFSGLSGTPEEQAETIVQHLMDNLLWLHDHWKPEYRSRSKMWYVGGNRIAHRWADRYGASPAQVAGVIAVLSPQKDWFQNVSLAERILEAVVNNADIPWDAKMTELVGRRDWGAKEVPDPSVYEGKTLRELIGDGAGDSLLKASVWIRAWDEANNPQMARVITPEGGFSSDFDTGKGGKPVAMRWQSFPAVAKALQVLMATNPSEISAVVGTNHKVRSFYNNIIAPYAGDDVTIDTHAVAGALLRPLGSSSTEVFHNFGGGPVGSPGPKNSSITGQYGTYAIYAEAYRRAADERGILPREMQSITWEAVRGLFRPEQKSTKIKGESDRIWSAYAAGEIDASEARNRISELVGGIVDSAWVRFPAGTHESSQDSSYAGEVYRDGGPQGTADGRGGVDAAAGTQQDNAADVNLYQSAQDERDLVVTHNLTGENLLHAAKMGGLPVPSLAVTKKDHPLTGFGEITLIGSKEMADPRGYAGTKVFGADIYSPRYPRITFSFTPNMKKRAEAIVQDGLDATKSYIDWSEVADKGVDALATSSGVMWKFLNDKGIEPKIVRNEPKPLPTALAPFANDTRHAFDIAKDPAFVEAAWQAHIDMLTQAYDGDQQAAIEEAKQTRANSEERGTGQLLMGYARQIEQFQRDTRDAGTIDTWRTRTAMQDQIREGGLETEFRDSVMEFLRSINPDEKIFQGFTPSGNRRYIPHTLENVVKILKKELRAGENFNYGVGSIRAKFTPQFKSIAEIRKAKNRLMNKDAFEDVKNEIDDDFFALAEQLGEFHPVGGEFRFSDTMTSMMYDAAKMGVPRALKENGFDEVPAENQKAIAEFLGKLRTLPTEYFEAKILREVDLAEFSGAVIPKDTDPKVVEALKKRGVNDIRFYEKHNEADRAAKIAEFEHLFFQNRQAPRGGFSPETNAVTLLKNADLTTFLHESAHYFFENDIGLASELVGKETLTAGEQQIVDDVSRLLTWHGIQGDVTEQLRQWNTMDFEEQRSYHERTAESFEAYLFTGKAPSLELQPIFQRFASWMVNVYKSLKEFLTRNPEAGKLNDEVRAVFDRMIATQEEIALAEQARSMLPLFGNPEQSGMTPEAFAAYQAQGKEATDTAVQELQAKGLRDLQWLANAKGRQVARLKREAKGLRSEVELEARRDVLSQPIYQAWGFLTRKLGQEDQLPALERKSDPDVLDPTLDSLFVAIAKLGGIKKDMVVSEWGVDPKDIPQSGLFGKPVWRITDGLTLDGMAEALSQHGYLPLDENGKYELNDLADRFIEELAGNTQYSHAYQPQDLQPGEQIANPAGLGAGRLDLAGLASIGATDEVINALKARRMTAKEGLHPDLVAQMFDFSSGDELIRELAAAQPPKEAITELADQMMLERHGELATPEAIEQAADAAIHNEARARFVATEYNALAQATGKPKLLAIAARDFAAQMIARLKVRDIRPSQYANAETRAAKAAEKASKSGKLAEAAAEKRNQLVNLYATRAAYDAKDEVQAGVRYLRKFEKRSKTLDQDYQDQIDAMLERFDLKPASLKAIDRRKSLAQWLAAQREAGIEPDISPELENEANRKSYKDMTVEEFRGLIDTIKQIEHLGRLKNKLLTAQDQREFKVIVDEVSTSIVDNGGKAKPVELEPPTGLRPWLQGLAAAHRKLASLVRQMDGGKDNGPLWRVLVRGMNEAATGEAVMNEQATIALAEIYKPILAMKGGVNGDKQFIPEINDSLTRGGRLSVALNWGNATNRARIIDGDNWSQHQVQAILNRLTRAEWDFVNAMWAHIDSYWPQIEAKEKRVTGRAPEKVKAEPFTIMVDGETVSLTGGYYPIKYDTNRDDRAEKLEASELAKDMLRGAFTRATTRRGHTKERVEGVKRPVRKSLDVITQHISEVVHDLSWHEWLIDANRLIDAKPINQAIREHYGAEVIRTMKDSIVGIATADIVPQTKIDTAMLYLRANVSRSTMGLSLTTAFLQPFGLAQSMVRIGTKHVARGMARWLGDAARFESSMTWISAKSDFMRIRNKTFNRELNEIKGRVSKGHSKAREVYDASLFILMQKMQMVSDVPTWIGAYEKALSENHDDETAVALADQAVLDSQGGGQTKDMAQVQRKHPFLTQFYSYFNTTLNLVAESTAKTSFKNPLAVAGWASDMALLLIIPALAPAMLLALMRGEECEGEECAKKIIQAQAGYLLNTIVGLRELTGEVAGYDYAGPPVGRVVTELGRVGAQAAQGEADEAAAMSVISLAGVSLGIPTTQILRSWRGWNAWAEGDAPVSSILMGPPPKD